MRLPLELVHMILNRAENSYTHKELLNLRCINSLFDEEVLNLTFAKRGPGSGQNLIFSDSWDAIPAGFREKYLYDRVAKLHTEPSLFVNLFSPVFESQLAKLGIATSDRVTRHVQLKKWCRFSMHQLWGLEWVILHAECEFVESLYDSCDEFAVGDGPERRVEYDRKFLEICCGIVDDDREAVLCGFSGFCSGVDDLNPCFGTTLLGVAVKEGSCDMLKLLLRSTRSTPEKHLYIYLRLASAREGSATLVKILLDRFSGTDAVRKHLTLNILLKSIVKKDYSIFNVVVRWMVEIPNFYGKLSILELCAKKLLAEDDVQNFLSYPAPKRVTKIRSTLSIIPAYQLGKAYERRLKAPFTTLQPVVDSNWGVPRRTDGFIAYSIYPTPPSTLFVAVSKGLLNWVEWLLWAGADPRHLEGEISILDFAWRVGKRSEVAMILHDYGWDAERLEVHFV